MTEPHTLTLLMSEFVTHDVKRFLLSRPPGLSFRPGQGMELAINRPGWTDRGRPFTPTCLADDKVIEFIIKSYPEHAGVTRELHRLEPGAELLLSEPFGTIHYQGPGVFIAGGAGITPFIAILRELARRKELDGNSLFFSNKTRADIICEKELRHYLGARCFLTCTAEQAAGYDNRRLDRAFLAAEIRDFDQHFYVCGPPGFMKAVTGALRELGADPQSLVFER
ncbi:MAG: FAD-binding oxidoreductase [Gammaproteobacteria bacterium]|jgi:cytochrome-b5 reductase